jgi:hypothetical protein
MESSLGDACVSWQKITILLGYWDLTQALQLEDHNFKDNFSLKDFKVKTDTL